MATVFDPTDPIICHCLGIRASEIEGEIQFGRCEKVKDIMRLTQAGSGCTACHYRIRQMIAAGTNQPAGASPICIAR